MTVTGPHGSVQNPHYRPGGRLSLGAVSRAQRGAVSEKALPRASIRKRVSAVQRREIGKHLATDMRVCHGRLTFKDTRVPVETVLRALARGETFEQVLEGSPQIARPAITATLQLAAA